MFGKVAVVTLSHNVANLPLLSVNTHFVFYINIRSWCEKG